MKKSLQVKEAEEKMNLIFNLVSSNLRLYDVRWGRTAIIMYGFYAIMTCYTCFEKADFLNLTIAIMGLFMFLDPQQTKFSYLRLIVLYVLPLSQLYDLFWLVQNHSAYMNDIIEGGMAQTVLMTAYLMFIFKIFLWVVMWKASLNYAKFVRQQRELVGLR